MKSFLVILIFSIFASCNSIDYTINFTNSSHLAFSLLKTSVDATIDIHSSINTSNYIVDLSKGFNLEPLGRDSFILAKEKLLPVSHEDSVIYYDAQFEKARQLAANVFMIDEFIVNEIEKGNIRKEQFTKEQRTIKLHGHCQQKALSSVAPSVKLLSPPENYKVEVIPSGCCGMAGSFGYEKEHYDLSMKIGELVLFPTVRKQTDDVIIAAPGTSCRHQVKDGTGKKALHSVEVLWEALV